jgi:arylsulfatase A-like enzyme
VTKPGTRSDELVSNIDFAETFLDIAGADVPNDMQGRSLVPVIKGKTPEDWRTALYYHYYEYPGPHSVRRHYGVRTKDHKLIHYYNLDEYELFDMQKDPDELNSVYDDSDYEKVAKDLKRRVKEFQDLYQVPDDSGTITKDGKVIKGAKPGNKT